MKYKGSGSGNERLSEHLTEIDEDLLGIAYAVDDARKMEVYIKSEKRADGKTVFFLTPMFRRATVIAVCLVLVAGAVFAIPALLGRGGGIEHNRNDPPGEVILPGDTGETGDTGYTEETGDTEDTGDTDKGNHPGDETGETSEWYDNTTEDDVSKSEPAASSGWYETTEDDVSKSEPAVSSGWHETTDGEESQGGEYEYSDTVILANSWQEFNAKIEDCLGAGDTNELIQTVREQNLNITRYDIQKIEYVRNKDAGGRYDGRGSLNFYWHGANCTSCEDRDCEEIRMHLFYLPDGVDQIGVTKGYNKTENSELYVKEFNNGKTAYVFLINDRYFCRFVINRYNTDKDEIAEGLVQFCQETKNVLNDKF